MNTHSFKGIVRKMVKDKMKVHHHRMLKHFPESHKHRHLQRVQEIDECQPTCDLNDEDCYCQRLTSCTNDMSKL